MLHAVVGSGIPRTGCTAVDVIYLPLAMRSPRLDLGHFGRCPLYLIKALRFERLVTLHLLQVQDMRRVGGPSLMDAHTAAQLAAPGSGLWQHPAVAGRRLAAPSLQDVLAAMSPQLWDFRTNSTSSGETAELAAAAPNEGLTPTPASTPHHSPGGTPLGMAGHTALHQHPALHQHSALHQHPALHQQHPPYLPQRSAAQSPLSAALDADAGVKKSAVRPRELRITATSGIGTLLEAINVLGAWPGFPAQADVEPLSGGA